MKPRILIIDDEQLIRWALDRIFRQEVFDVDAAENTDEAVRFAQANSYGLILADLEICGDQARTFFPELLHDQREAKVIIITALPVDQAELQLGDFKAHRIMEKPFASEEIRAVVKDAIGGQGREPQA